MNKRNFFSKAVAWSLITTLVNPAAMAPAFARDTDIFLMTNVGISTAEPSILIILDTSDSMNLPEAWKEYPGAYDSHIEYLWNDINVISNTEQTTESNSKISTADGTTVAHPTSPYGFWDGATLADRRALWTAAKNYANATEGTDPGPRSTWRNYSEGSPSYPALANFYWLPAGTATTASRLRSPMFNRFRGYQSSQSGVRGGLVFPNTTDYSANNACSASLSTLTPSTVFHPDVTPRNSGVYLNDQWFRWEQWLALDAQNTGVYPGSQTITNNYVQGLVDSSIAPPVSWSPLPASRPARDNYGPNNNNNNDCSNNNNQNNSNCNTQNEGQPIRIRNAVNSYAGWTDVKADLGGFEFESYVKGLSGPTLQNIRSFYAYNFLSVASGAAGSTPSEWFSAWLGNRDTAPAPTFDRMTGTPAYFDTTSSPFTACDPAIGPKSSFCIQMPSLVGYTLTKTRNCSYVPGLTELDATGVTRRYNGTCASAVVPANNTCGSGITCTATGAGVPASPDYTTVANPPACPPTPAKDNTFYNIDYKNCSWTNRLSVTVANCAWAGRSSVYVEGQGYFYYGGTCTESGSASSCTAGGSTQNINGVSRANVMGPYTADTVANQAAGCSNALNNGTYWYGGTCQGANVDVGTTLRGGTPPGSPLPAAVAHAVVPPAVVGTDCTLSNSVTASQTIRGVTYTNAVQGNSQSGCNDKNDNNQTCSARGGYGGVQCDAQGNNNNVCTNQVTTASSSPFSYYLMFSIYTTSSGNTTLNANANLVHDCKADAPTANGSAYMRGAAPLRTFGTNYNTTNNNASATASYTTVAASSVAYDATKNIDVYSVNYLNWMFGPKGPNSAPIGRKTRLQVAKDALSTLVQTTDGVRFGLGVFNKTAGCSATLGTITTATNQLTVNDPTQFAVTSPITILGAGAAGGNLNTTVTAITGSVYTIGANASTTVSNAVIQANPCNGVGSNEGANIAYGIKRMGSNASDVPDYNNRASLINAINAVVAQARTPLTETLYEAYRYFSGRTPKFGTSSIPASGGGVVSAGRDTSVICTAAGAGTGCTAIGAYKSPMLNNPTTASPAGCQKNFIVMITDGGPEDDWSANGDIKSLSWSGPLGIVAPRTGIDATNVNTTTDQFEVSANTPYGPQDIASTAFDGGYVWLDELAYFMAHADISPGARNIPGDSLSDTISGRQSITTYTIGFNTASSQVLQNTALDAHGVYYTAENSSALSAALTAALAAITSWNPTIAAPTVPISALNRSENASDIYLSFFQPDPSSAWLGTVKKFELSQYPDNGDPMICGIGVGLCLIGQTQLIKDTTIGTNQSPVFNIETIVSVDKNTGIAQAQVDDNGSSYWAPPSLKDGGSPVMGGTGHQLVNNTATLTPDTRKLYTFLTDSIALQDGNSGSTIDLTNSVNRVHFSNPTKISKCRLGDSAACGGTATLTAATQETRINWIRGGDIGSTPACNDGAASTCTVWRTWPHSDVQHSKAAIVTYDGTPKANPYLPQPPNPKLIATKQYLYYVQNNGLLTAADTETGIEKWSFMVEEALPRIQGMISDNAGASAEVADGSPTIYFEDINANGIVDGADKVWLFFGLRRGGRIYYAIDITQPDAPQFGWKIDATTTPAKRCVANGVCANAPEFNELGQTWSQPFVGKVRANTNPVLIFGGGYDAAEDTQPPGTRTMGRAVFVVDAYNATIVQSWGSGQSGPFLGSGAASMIYAIPSDVTALNTDLDAQGFLDRLYVGDTGGNLWRFDIDSANVANWNGKLLATLSSDIVSGELRKILFPPAAAKQNAPYRFDAVYVGTGDREHPLCLTANQTTPTVNTNSCPRFVAADKMFMVVDRDYGLAATNTVPITIADLGQRLTNDIVTNSSNTILNTKKGWYRDYDNGEKTTNSPTVFNQRLRFGTYAPLGSSAGACAPLGEGRLNEIDALTGDLVTINGSVTQASDRYYSSFITHGYISTGQLIVQGKNIFHIVVSDSRLQSVLVGNMGSATKIYWYLEPEQ